MADTSVVVFVSTGAGFTSHDAVPSFGKTQGFANHNEYPIITGNLNDDGLTDIGRVKSDSVVLYISNGTSFELYGTGIGNLSPGQGFANHLEYPIITGDFAGIGKTGLGRVSASGVVFYTPFGQACDLAKEFTSTAGNVTQITYTPSSEYDNTLLPFVVPTVSELTTNDGLGNTSTTCDLPNYGRRFCRISHHEI